MVSAVACCVMQLKPFMALPSREEWPEYYSRIASPICINDIYRKTQAHAYPAVQDAVQDWELLASNAEQVWAGARVRYSV